MQQRGYTAIAGAVLSMFGAEFSGKGEAAFSNAYGEMTLATDDALPEIHIRRQLLNPSKDFSSADLAAMRAISNGNERELYIIDRLVTARAAEYGRLTALELSEIAVKASYEYDQGFVREVAPPKKFMEGTEFNLLQLSLSPQRAIGMELIRGAGQEAGLGEPPTYDHDGVVSPAGRAVNEAQRSRAFLTMRAAQIAGEADPEFNRFMQARVERRENGTAAPLLPEGLWGKPHTEVVASGDPFAKMLDAVSQENLDQRITEVQGQFSNELRRTQVAVETMQKSIKELNLKMDTVTDQVEKIELRQRLIELRNQDRELREKSIHEIRQSAANAQAVLGFANMAAGMLKSERDKEVARGAIAVASFGVSVREQLALVGKASTPLGAAFAIGQGAQNLFNLLSGAPSGNALILEQLKLVREEIQEMRKEMHERFDVVDAELDGIAALLIQGFEDVRNNQQKIADFLSAIDTKVDGLREQLIGLDGTVRAGFDADWLVKDEEMLALLEPQGGVMPDERAVLQVLEHFKRRAAGVLPYHRYSSNLDSQPALTFDAAPGALAAASAGSSSRLNFVVGTMIAENSKQGDVPDPAVSNLKALLREQGFNIPGKAVRDGKFIPDCDTWLRYSKVVRALLLEHHSISEDVRQRIIEAVERPGRELEAIHRALRDPKIVAFLMAEHEKETDKAAKTIQAAQSAALLTKDVRSMNVWNDASPAEANKPWTVPSNIKLKLGTKLQDVPPPDRLSEMVPERLQIAAALGFGNLGFVVHVIAPKSIVEKEWPEGPDGPREVKTTYYVPRVKLEIYFTANHGKPHLVAQGPDVVIGAGREKNFRKPEDANNWAYNSSPWHDYKNHLVPNPATWGRNVKECHAAIAEVQALLPDYQKLACDRITSELAAHEARLRGIEAVLFEVVRLGAGDLAISSEGDKALDSLCRTGENGSFIDRYKSYRQAELAKNRVPVAPEVYFENREHIRFGFPDGYLSGGKLGLDLPKADELAKRIEIVGGKSNSEDGWAAWTGFLDAYPQAIAQNGPAAPRSKISLELERLRQLRSLKIYPMKQ